MRCSACGTEVTEQAVYCHKCGERLDPARDQSISAEPGKAATTTGPRDVDPPVSKAGPTATDQGKAAVAPIADEPEKELWRGGYCPRAMIGGWLGAGSCTILLLFLAIWIGFGKTLWIAAVVLILVSWLYVLVMLAYRHTTVRYVVTTQRFISERGLLRRITDRIEMIEIDDITFSQGVLERFVGVGTIVLLSSDRSHPQLTMRGIENVKEVADIIDDARRSERRRRGLHIEQI